MDIDQTLPVYKEGEGSIIWTPPEPVINDDGTVDYPEGEGYPAEPIPEQNLSPIVVDDDYLPGEDDYDV